MTPKQNEALHSILVKYFSGELDDETNEIIYEAACELTLSKARIYLAEITYGIGYSKSLLRSEVGEATYKKLKTLCKNNIYKRLKEGNRI